MEGVESESESPACRAGWEVVPSTKRRNMVDSEDGGRVRGERGGAKLTRKPSPTPVSGPR